MAKRSKGAAYHYRDTRSGRFVPKSTWKRSKAQGGTRYKREKQEPKPEGEYQINVKYKPSDKKTKVEVQISAIGPVGASRNSVLDAVEKRRKTGEDPEGWTINITEWRKAGKVFKSEEGWTQLGFFFAESVKGVK